MHPFLFLVEFPSSSSYREGPCASTTCCEVAYTSPLCVIVSSPDLSHYISPFGLQKRAVKEHANQVTLPDRYQYDRTAQRPSQHETVVAYKKRLRSSLRSLLR
ncbi:hypothetical protein Trydic_g20041 [Trypoxylus dichotomus]